METHPPSSNRARYVATILLAGCTVVFTEAAISLDLAPLLVLVPGSVWFLFSAIAVTFGIGCTWIWRKRFRFSIKAILLLVLFVAWPASRFANEIGYETRRANAQRINLEAMLALGPRQVSMKGRYTDGRNDHEIQRWLFALFVNALDQNEIPHELAYIDNVDFSGTKLSDKDMPSIAELQNVETLDLSGTAVTDLGLAYVSKLTSLREIRLKGTAVSAEAVEDIKTHLPNVTVIQ